jgi:gentisate 1,2-dioxygenase
LAVPGGSWFEHVNGDNRQPAILFVASDEPALKCFHLFKKWGRDAAGGIVKIA